MSRSKGSETASRRRYLRFARLGFALLLALVGSVLPAGGMSAPVLASGLSFNYPDFSSVAGLQLNGSAAQAGNVLRLTPPANFAAGSAFYTTPINTAQSFQTQFQLSLHDGSSPPADGITFSVQNSPGAASALGGNGGDLGYGGSYSGTGISPSVAVEFDIYQNGGDLSSNVPGQSSNEVAIIENGDDVNHKVQQDSAFPLYGAGTVYAWVDYDASAQTLQVFVSQDTNKPSQPIVSFGVNLSTLGSTAYVGFTGGTGGSVATQDILSWAFAGGGGGETPGPPQNVRVTPYNGKADVSWQPPSSDGGSPITSYLVSFFPAFPSDNEQTVPVNGTTCNIQVCATTVQGLLHDCVTQYTFEVEAINAVGRGVGAFSSPVLTSGIPTRPPKVVVILANGVNTSIGDGTYDPLKDVPTYCASSDGLHEDTSRDPKPVQGMIGNWGSENSAGAGVGFGAGNRLTDTLASVGAVLLPFSVKGAHLSEAPTAPTFTFTGYSIYDIGSFDPRDRYAHARTLNDEITSVHTVWPSARIVVVGHSQGGLIAHDWWIKYGFSAPSGVVQVYSLDSPINGVAFKTPASSGSFLGVSANLFNEWHRLYTDQVYRDTIDVELDRVRPLFTPIGTVGDPVWDAFDQLVAQPGCQSPLCSSSEGIGLLSQVYFGEPKCVGGAPEISGHIDLSACTVVGQSFIDPYPCWPLPDSGAPLFGLPDDQGLHGVVMNCPGVITKIMSYVSG
jgi:Legume lectin domain/Fibronectin type III domain